MRHQRPTQVIVLGHRLSRATMQWLKSQGPYKIYKILFHVDRFDRVFDSVKEVMRELHAQGCDLSGNTPTIFQPTGSTVGALVIASAWAGLTGQLPSFINLIRNGDATYAPSPELPVLDLHGFAIEIHRDCQEYGIRVISEDPETAEATAVDDGLVFGGILKLASARNEFRPLRELQFEKKPYESQTQTPEPPNQDRIKRIASQMMGGTTRAVNG